MLLIKGTPKVHYAFLAFLTLLSLSFRAGYIYQHRADTWEMSFRVVTISENGMVPWMLDPLSLFGWYPLSYATGQNLLLSAIQQITGQNILFVAYFGSAFFGVFGIFSIYLLALQIKRNYLFIFLSTFIFITCNQVISHTWNNLSTRGLFMVLYPIALFLLFRIYQSPNHRFSNIFLFLALFLTLASVHRMIVLFVAVIILPYLFLILIKILKIELPILPVRKYSNAISVFLLILFTLQFTDFALIENEVTRRQQTPVDVFSSTFIVFEILELILNYTVQYNLFVVIIPFGVIFLVYENFQDFTTRFFILSLSISLLFVRDIFYFAYFFSPLFAILAALSVYNINSKIGNRGDKKFVNFILYSVIIFSMRYILWFVQEGYLDSLVICISGIVLLLFSIYNNSPISNKKYVSSLIVLGLILCSLSYTWAVTHNRAEDLRIEQENNSGKLVQENRMIRSSTWVNSNIQHREWVSEHAEIRRVLGALAVPPGASELELSNNYLLRAEMETNFETSLFFESGKNIFTYELSNRYDPDHVGNRIIYHSDLQIAEQYDISWMVFTKDGYTEGNSFVNYDFIELNSVKFLKSERYVCYNDNNIIVSFYGE